MSLGDWYWDWTQYASCDGMDVNFFYDKYENDEYVRQSVAALCNSCPVKSICEEEGVKNKEWGVWGGKYLKDGKPQKSLTVDV